MTWGQPATQAPSENQSDTFSWASQALQLWESNLLCPGLLTPTSLPLPAPEHAAQASRLISQLEEVLSPTRGLSCSQGPLSPRGGAPGLCVSHGYLSPVNRP